METENQMGGVGARDPLTFITIKQHCERGHRSTASHYRDINDGLMVPSINFGDGRPGSQAVIAEHESNFVLAARLAGQSPEQIRALVKSLVASRSKLFDRLTQELQLELNQEPKAA